MLRKKVKLGKRSRVQLLTELQLKAESVAESLVFAACAVRIMLELLPLIGIPKTYFTNTLF